MFGRAWMVGIYCVPAGAGALTSTIWNRRDVLFAPSQWATLFARWAWFMGKPGSPSERMGKVCGDAKLFRAGISQGAQFVRNLGPLTGYSLCASVFKICVWGISCWIHGAHRMIPTPLTTSHETAEACPMTNHVTLGNDVTRLPGVGGTSAALLPAPGRLSRKYPPSRRLGRRRPSPPLSGGVGKGRTHPQSRRGK